MAKFVFDKIVTGEEIKGIIQKDLGPAYRVEVKKNRLEIVQDASKGCYIFFQDKDGSTVCRGPSGYMPFGVLRVAIVLGALALLTLVFYRSENYLVLGIGALLLSLLLRAPSRELVKRVAGILEKVASKA
ncbi:MAG: hypothetical protein Q8N39_11040 [Pelolinea sp.]|nr:hypothetical protein [Pelolinea sp.]